jgi:riboflavin kinase/FMN adenylyltransferase
MRVDNDLPRRADGDAPVALTIGNFDGVHRGHVALLDSVRSVAEGLGAETAVLTFDPNPRCVLDPPNCPLSLTTLAEKQSVLAAYGVDRLAVLRFTRQVSGWGAEQFCDILRSAYDLRALVVGYDFALGHKRKGDVAFLRDYGSRHGIAVLQVGEVLGGAEAVSSSRARALVSAGDVAGAASLLGRPYFIDARVEHGEEVGRHLGFPTANLSIAPDKCLPAPGVYAMWVRVDGVWHPAATNVGYRPTFGGDRLTVEAYLLDFSGDLYDRDVRAVFVDRLREERTYPNVEELVAQIATDVEDVRALLGRGAPPAQLG